MNQETQFFREDTESTSQRVIKSGLASIALIGGSAAAIKYGLDSSLVPEAPYVPEIVDGLVIANDGIRNTALGVMMGGTAYQTYHYIKSKFNVDARNESLAASVDFSGVESYASNNDEKHRSRKILSRIGGVALFANLFVGTFSGVEHEVSNGPLRPIEATFNTILPVEEGESRSIELQSGNITFMDDSYIERDEEDNSKVYFGKYLPTIDGKSGLVVTLPDEFYEQVTDTTTKGSCEDPTTIVDESSGIDIGEDVDINGKEFLVIDTIDDVAQMNRAIAITSQEDYSNCISGHDENIYFGSIMEGSPKDNIEKGSERSVIVSEEQFEANNRSFWQKNGTPIILLSQLATAAVATAAIANELRGRLFRNIKEIGAIRAMGRPMRDFFKIESLRAVKESAHTTALAAPIMPALALVLNASEFGLRVGVGVREIAVGYTITLVSKLVGVGRGISRFSKKLNLSQTVR